MIKLFFLIITIVFCYSPCRRQNLSETLSKLECLLKDKEKNCDKEVFKAKLDACNEKLESFKEREEQRSRNRLLELSMNPMGMPSIGGGMINPMSMPGMGGMMNPMGMPGIVPGMGGMINPMGMPAMGGGMMSPMGMPGMGGMMNPMSMPGCSSMGGGMINPMSMPGMGGILNPMGMPGMGGCPGMGGMMYPMLSPIGNNPNINSMYGTALGGLSGLQANSNNGGGILGGIINTAAGAINGNNFMKKFS